MPVDIGSRRLTPTGLPVQVAEIQAGGAMLLQSLVSDNRIAVPPEYPLLTYRESDFETRARAYSRRPKGAEIRSTPRPPKTLAPLIDAMLLAGNRTMRGILRELRRRASAACRGKDLKANVRARMYWLRKRGYRVERLAKDEKGECRPRRIRGLLLVESGCA
ncbi:MAG: hypothetical protein HY549_12405 [Elusimicrobia bacterium]|nr:hypothetical protein [Elusimicrobiota bacterium]